MKVIVTGGAGFIGSHLVDALILAGEDVHIIDNLSSGHLEQVNEKAKVHVVDICSEQARKILLEVKPDVIFHLAAQADVGKSIQDPVYDADVNIKGTLNMLEASREANVKKFIFASTSAVYGNLNNEFLSEEDPTFPESYYGLSKLTAESYIKLYNKLYALPYTILRYANVYGPRQLPKGEGGVISVFLNRLQAEETLNVHGDGEQTRDFIYVTDIVSANIAALSLANKETIQVSTSKRTSINTVLKQLSSIHGSPIQTVFTDSRKGDIKDSCLCNTKACKLLNWQPQIDILNGLVETYNSHKKNSQISMSKIEKL